MSKFIKYFILISAILFVTGVRAQWNLKQFSGKDGLSQNTVKSIIQDSNGFIWIGTYDGVNKYDGYTMKHYYFSDENDGLSSNLIHSLFEDKDGYIWAGTSDAGINRIDPRTDEVIKYFDTSKTSDYFKNVSNIYQSTSGVFFYVSESKLKLFKIAEDGGLLFDKTVTSINGKEFNFRENVIASNNGIHWILTGTLKTKLWQFEIINKGNDVSISLHETNLNSEFFTQGYVENLYEYPKNTFWVLSNKLELRKVKIDNQLKVIENELIQLLPEKNNKSKLNYTNNSIQADKNNRLWFSGSKLLLSYDIESGSVVDFSNNKNYEIKHKQFLKSIVDSSNVLWLGTLYNGLFKIDLDNKTFLNSNHFINIKKRQSQKFHKYPIMAMCEDANGNIWFGTQGIGGLAVLKEKEIEESILNISTKPWSFNYLNQDKRFQNINFLNIRRLFVDSNNTIWVGSKSGLSTIKKETTNSNYQIKKFDNFLDNSGSKISSSIFSIEEDSNKSIWVGYWGGGLLQLNYNTVLQKYEYRNYQFNSNDTKSLSNNYVRDIMEDSDQNLWIGTVNGLNKIEKGANHKIQFKRYFKEKKSKNSLSNNHVLDIFQSKNGKLYVGTFGGGLNEITENDDGTLNFRHFTIKEGLPSNVVYQIKEDNDGNIWMLHVRELSKLNTKTGEIIYFDKEDGFDVDEFKDNSMLLTSSGTLLCGGVNGFTFFKPNQISVNKHPPKINIIDFKLFEESIKPNEKYDGRIILTKHINETLEIELPYNLNSMEFVFSSVHFSNPEKNKYRFILEGFEDKWQTSMGNERRFASYTNVPPGKYVFKVYGSNSAGVWVKEPKEITIIINSPWYLTSFAVFGFLMLFISVVVIISRVRLNQVRLASQLKLETALHEKSDEINKMKLQFFTNISHELRTPLTLIIGPLQQIMQGNTDSVYLKKLNQVMYRNSLRLLKLINQLLDFRKAESGNLKLAIQDGDLVKFVEEIYNSFEEITFEKDIKFVFLPSTTDMNAWFDKDKVEKILYNLLSNAIKFTPKGKSIKLTIDKVINNGIEYAKIEVIDYGLGIAEDELESIFERFYQAKKENNSLHIGSGLGLAYTNHLVKIHKGKIDIKSKLHEGTTCSVLIPMNRSSYSVDDIIENQINQHDFRFIKNEISDIKVLSLSQPYPQETIEHSDDTQTLLIVEDNKELQNYLYNYFSTVYKVVTANNGEEGLEQAKKHLPNIIMSDLMMPKMDGIEMCKKIKTDIHTSHIPVVILTAKSGLENEKEGLETGADEFVLKPFNIEILKLRIENILRTKQLWIQKFQGNSSSASFLKLSNKIDQDFLDKCIGIIATNIDNTEFSVESFAMDVAMSRSALFKKIKSITGQSTSEFIRVMRLKKAATHLKSGRYSITEVIFMVGFSDPKYFRTCFKKQFGKTPSDYIKSLKQ